jgi:hypothetical protein
MKSWRGFAADFGIQGFQIDSRGLMTMGANLARSVGLLDQDMLADEQLQAVEVAEDSDVSDDS